MQPVHPPPRRAVPKRRRSLFCPNSKYRLRSTETRWPFRTGPGSTPSPSALTLHSSSPALRSSVTRDRDPHRLGVARWEGLWSHHWTRPHYLWARAQREVTFASVYDRNSNREDRRKAIIDEGSTPCRKWSWRRRGGREDDDGERTEWMIDGCPMSSLNGGC